MALTDALSGKQDVARILDFVENVAKESRKALTIEFSQKHKGVPFESVPNLLRTSLETWVAKRDKNLRLTFEGTNSAKPGEVRTVFVGEMKGVRFKLHADATFSLSGGTQESPSYLKQLNVTVDRRAFDN